MDPRVADITEQLQRHRQRATYEAVSDLLGRPNAHGFMGDEEKNYRNSWVVSKTTGLPKKYSPEQVDPEVVEQNEIGAKVIDTARELQEWLDRHNDD